MSAILVVTQRSLAACLLLMLTQVIGASAACAETNAPATLAVTGQGLIKVRPDLVSLQVGVITQAQDVDEALTKNTERLLSIRAELEKLDLTPAEIQTRQFQIQPIYTPRPREAAEGWQPGIEAYRVTNTLQIQTRHIDRIGRIISHSAGAGANQIGSVRFSLAEPSIHRQAAIDQASEQAQRDAGILASAIGVRLKRIIHLSLDRANMTAPRAQRQFVSNVTSPPDIAVGEITLQASVTLQYEVE